MGGTKIRMKNFAHYIMKEINYELPVGAVLHDITAGPDRYSMYKVRDMSYLHFSNSK